MKNNYSYHNREISWLAFNERVLQEAADPTVPLIERLRFLGIFSSNLDEFYRVRVAGIRNLKGIGKKAREALNTRPKLLLQEISTKTGELQQEFAKVYSNLRKELKEQNILIINETKIAKEQKLFLDGYFENEIRPRLLPVMLNYVDAFPALSDASIHLAIHLLHEESPLYSLIEIPKTLSRFVELPKAKNKQYIILIEDVIRLYLKDIFKQFEFDDVEAFIIKVTRDAELNLESDFSKSLIQKIAKSVDNRKHGDPVRFIYDKRIHPDLLKFLIEKLNLEQNENNIAGGRNHNFKDFIGFPKLNRPDLVNPPAPSLSHPAFENGELMFDVLRKKDVLLHYPYQKFSYLNDFLREATLDPNVTTIKMTLYRVARYSSVASSLINAAKNGKKVIAVVELQARFDEESNIYWAEKMHEAGVQVVYGVPGLKVHAKICLVSRIVNGKRTRFVNFSTGNFNENTAKIYSDMSLFTSSSDLTYEANKLFQFFEKNYKHYNYKHLIISPTSSRKKYLELIDEEIANAKAKKPAFIFAKMNSLVDNELIDKLYEASSAGVDIKLIVRGICALIGQQPGYSENIQVLSIVDKYLEHSRVFIFCNNNEEKTYLSSADWMKRNMDIRVEVGFPVYDAALQQEIKDFMNLQWNDNTKGRWINKELNNAYKELPNDTKNRSQTAFYDYLKEKK